MSFWKMLGQVVKEAGHIANTALGHIVGLRLDEVFELETAQLPDSALIPVASAQVSIYQVAVWFSPLRCQRQLYLARLREIPEDAPVEDRIPMLITALDAMPAPFLEEMLGVWSSDNIEKFVRGFTNRTAHFSCSWPDAPVPCRSAQRRLAAVNEIAMNEAISSLKAEFSSMAPLVRTSLEVQQRIAHLRSQTSGSAMITGTGLGAFLGTVVAGPVGGVLGAGLGAAIGTSNDTRHMDRIYQELLTYSDRVDAIYTRFASLAENLTTHIFSLSTSIVTSEVEFLHQCSDSVPLAPSDVGRWISSITIPVSVLDSPVPGMNGTAREILKAHYIDLRGLGLSGGIDRIIDTALESARVRPDSTAESQPFAPEAEPHDELANAYAVLGISPPTDRSSIKRAYREKVQRFHPDKIAHLNLDQAFMDFAGEQVTKLTAARDTLLKSIR